MDTRCFQKSSRNLRSLSSSSTCSNCSLFCLQVQISAEAAKARGGFGTERYETADFQEKVGVTFIE